jgi:hypothetical protein
MLTSRGDGIWCDAGPVRIVGMPLTSTMTVLRLGPGLLVHSPLPLSTERRAAVEALGPVTHLYAPNTFHHRWLGEWSQAFPNARMHAPGALAKRRPDLRIDRCHDSEAAPEFAGVLDEVPIEGFLLKETALVYRPARAAVVADLVHNIGRPQERWTKIYSSLMGFYGRVALSRVIRWTAFYDRGAARRSIDALLGHDFDALIVGHGAALPSGGRAALTEALGFLPAAAVPRLPPRAKDPRFLSPKPCG